MLNHHAHWDCFYLKSFIQIQTTIWKENQTSIANGLMLTDLSLPSLFFIELEEVVSQKIFNGQGQIPSILPLIIVVIIYLLQQTPFSNWFDVFQVI